VLQSTPRQNPKMDIERPSPAVNGVFSPQHQLVRINTPRQGIEDKAKLGEGLSNLRTPRFKDFSYITNFGESANGGGIDQCIRSNNQFMSKKAERGQASSSRILSELTSYTSPINRKPSYYF
jgi:hypothetical protein